jgi:nitrogen fixation/metabolism regulation signal transduction histidine kinase
MKNARKHILIQPKFQLRFAALITFTILVISLVFPIFFVSLFDIANTHPSISGNAALVQVIASAKSDFIKLTIGVQLILITANFLLAIRLSHRIVGPLYKLRISMVALRQGLLDRHISFRDKDNFPELAVEFNAMADAILARSRKDFEAVQSVLPKLDRIHGSLVGEEKAILAETLNVLRELSQEKKH